MKNNDYGKKFMEIIAEILEIPLEEINLDSCREDIEQWDSLAHVQMIAAIDQEFGISIPFECIDNIKTLRDLYNFIDKSVKQND